MHANKKLLIGAAATLSLLAAAPVQATAATTVGAQGQSATFYEHDNFCCSSFYVTADAGQCVNLPTHWKNIISSVKTNARVAFYDHDDCNWLIHSVNQDQGNLGGANDKANSVKVIVQG